MSESRGRFIVLEGVEGAGKSTQMECARNFLQARVRDLLVTREPGGAPASEAMREVLLDPAYQGLSPEAELLLVFAARAEHVAHTIAPALSAGRWVLSDRFIDASFAYQGAGRGLGSARVAALENWLFQGPNAGLEPDLVVVLDLPAEIGLARLADRMLDRFEREQVEFFERVRGAYLERAARVPERYAIIDATPGPEQVSRALCAVLAAFCKDLV